MIMNNIKIAKKKPIEIEVIQITGTDENIKEIQNFCGRWSFKRGGHIARSAIAKKPSILRC
jgi:predicted RNase H-like nuclease (RuvC/YqgF family)